MTPWAVSALLVGGAAFMLLSAVGLLRFPDFYTRMQAPTKAATLGMLCLMLAAMLHFGETAQATQALLITLFLFLTAPVAAHAIGRAAYRSGVPLWERTVLDELAGKNGAPAPGQGTQGSADQDDAQNQGDMGG